jgi:CRISPR-associated protein Cas1
MELHGWRSIQGEFLPYDTCDLFVNTTPRYPRPETRNPTPQDVDEIFVMGEIDINSHLLNFLSKHNIPLHLFNYYGFYSGSYYPRECRLAGALLVNQALHYADPVKRNHIAREFVLGAAHGAKRALKYYQRKQLRSAASETSEETGEAWIDSSSDDPEPREAKDDGFSREEELADIGSDSDTDTEREEDSDINDDIFSPILRAIADLEAQVRGIPLDESRLGDGLTGALMGLEGNIHENYYRAWPHILRKDPDLAFEKRVRHPPDNIVNCMISYGNGMLYATCIGAIYHTPLNPTISYLHEPGARRFSLAFDISEIFKPIIVDRLIFTLCNLNQIQAKHFQFSKDIVNGVERPICYLNDAGRRIFSKAYQEKLNSTIYHRGLKRHVSYETLIRMECHKLAHHLCGSKTYRALRAWW